MLNSHYLLVIYLDYIKKHIKKRVRDKRQKRQKSFDFF